MYKIMVLADGESYSDVIGCRILAITDKAHDILCEGGEVSHLEPKQILYEQVIEDDTEAFDIPWTASKPRHWYPRADYPPNAPE